MTISHIDIVGKGFALAKELACLEMVKKTVSSCRRNGLLWMKRKSLQLFRTHALQESASLIIETHSLVLYVYSCSTIEFY